MDWPRQCAVVIPCLNEAEHIGSVVQRVHQHLPTVFVVDDGSADETSRHAAAAGAHVVRHEQPRGKGAALREGWGRAWQQGFAWALCLDGDGQHAPEDIPQFLRCAEATGARLIVGNRMTQPRAMPWVRRWTNRFMSWRLSRVAGQNLPDSQNGFRLLHLETWMQLGADRSRAAHFEVESELLLTFARARQPIAFVPVRIIYGREKSKISPWRDTWRWWRWLRHWKRLS